MSNIRVISQYIKDLSFEAPNAPSIFLNPAVKPDIELSINIDAAKIAEEVFEVSLKISADAKGEGKRIFLCEIVYGAVFAIKDIEENMLEQILLIYCPNLIFPYLRRIVTNLTTDGGFPPLMLDPIDFADLYSRRKMASESAPINDTKN